MTRFASSKALVSYAGLAPRVKESAGYAKTGQMITKHGSPYLRAWAYLGAACARQYDDELKAYYERMGARSKHYNLALCATAAQLSERAYEILAEGRQQETESQDQLKGTG